jgi:cyclopropane-fatty-acyl-phospholipid synthase
MTLLNERPPATSKTPETSMPATARGIAGQLAALVEPLFGGTLPFRLRAWDGSEAGPADTGSHQTPVAILRSPAALRRLLWSPGELGLAQAYVTGELDVEGDLKTALSSVWATIRTNGVSKRRLSASQLTQAVATARRLGVIGRRLPAPPSQAQLTGRLHTRLRDRSAISHHYDLSNDFYALVLDPRMAYSCAYWTSDSPGYTLEDAQRDKFDLVARKLDLQPGQRLLDVGCGWGSMSLHAAANYGVSVTGVTLSREQQAFASQRAKDEGLADRVDIRLQDYRDVSDGPYDAVVSLEMGEHVGQDNYPVYAGQLHRQLRPEGRLLLQQMSRHDSHPGGGAFIESYIAPDMYMRPVGQTVDLLESAGFEVRDVHALREHYVRTVAAWYDTFERRWDEAVALVGEEVARVWRLYFVGGALAFEEGRMGVDQILAVKPAADGASSMPATRINYAG